MSKILYKSQNNYITKFQSSKDELVQEIEEFAETHRIPILDSNSIEILEQLVRIKKPRRVLELGTAIAYSTIRIARCLPVKGTIDTIEKSKDNIPLASKNIKKSGVADKIKLIKGEALEIIPGLSGKYDMIFLDADKEDYISLFKVSLPLLKKNGIYLVDNLLWHGYTASTKVPPKFKRSTGIIREFNEVFMGAKELITTIIPVGDGLGLGIKK